MNATRPLALVEVYRPTWVTGTPLDSRSMIMQKHPPGCWPIRAGGKEGALLAPPPEVETPELRPPKRRRRAPARGAARGPCIDRPKESASASASASASVEMSRSSKRFGVAASAVRRPVIPMSGGDGGGGDGVGGGGEGGCGHTQL